MPTSSRSPRARDLCRRLHLDEAQPGRPGLALARGALGRGRRPRCRHRPQRRRLRPGDARRDPALDLSRQGQGRGDRRSRDGRGDRARPDGLRAVARAAAQSRKSLGRQGHRPDRPDPRDLRPPRRAPRRARCRSSWPISTIRRAGWSAPGPISSASAAAAASSAAPARRRSSRTGGCCRTASASSSASSSRSSAPARCIAPAGARCRIRSSRWSATPMPANRHCSTA